MRTTKAERTNDARTTTETTRHHLPTSLANVPVENHVSTNALRLHGQKIVWLNTTETTKSPMKYMVAILPTE